MKRFQKFIYRLFDRLLLDCNIPFFGKIANKIRRSLARKICDFVGGGLYFVKVYCFTKEQLLRKQLRLAIMFI